MTAYTTRYLTIDEYKEWDALVLQSPNYSVFDTTLWLDTLSSVLNCEIKLLGVFEEENLIGGVAFDVIKKYGMKIAKIPPMSVFNSCHYVPRETQYKERQRKHIHNIVASIVERLQNDFHYVVIANQHEFKDIRGFLLKGWSQNILYSYIVYLNKIDFSLISPSRRKWIKKAQKKLIVTEEIKDVTPVYDIIKHTYIRQGIKCPLPLDKMSEMFKKISNNIVILAAKEQKNDKYKAVNISVVDYKKNGVYGLFNGFLLETPDSGANSLLQWKEIEYFKDKGFEFFDLGEASIPSKASFKGEFYSDLVPFYRVSKSSLPFSIVWRLTKGRIIQAQ
ncbi:MAG: FemAB family protein [Candidatus Scalindua rubra]|uniref:FemAB family protein n=1 Tax=Candidatus Scalindua rubra TaxID=1872076 RepID=A0A1E3X9Q1_9BACT|nr:MAG: FemAB family protein [Candidatus Scalindua rubra]